MKKSIIILILLSNLCFSQVKKESYLFNSLYFDISYFLWYDTYDFNYASRKMWLYEHNVFGKCAISITKSLYTGVLVNGVFTKRGYPSKHSDYYFICGIFGQYFLLNRQKVKMFVEMNLSWGDYNCYYVGLNEPTHEKWLTYLGTTGGIKWRLGTDKLFFKMSLTTQFIISKYKEFKVKQYSPILYLHSTLNLGICYYFGKTPYCKYRQRNI